MKKTILQALSINLIVFAVLLSFIPDFFKNSLVLFVISIFVLILSIHTYKSKLFLVFSGLPIGYLWGFLVLLSQNFTTELNHLQIFTCYFVSVLLWFVVGLISYFVLEALNKAFMFKKFKEEEEKEQ